MIRLCSPIRYIGFGSRRADLTTCTLDRDTDQIDHLRPHPTSLPSHDLRPEGLLSGIVKPTIVSCKGYSDIWVRFSAPSSSS